MDAELITCIGAAGDVQDAPHLCIIDANVTPS